MFYYCEPYFHALNCWMGHDEDLLRNRLQLLAALIQTLLEKAEPSASFYIEGDNSVSLLPEVKPTAGETFCEGYDFLVFKTAATLVNSTIFQSGGLYFQKHLLRSLSVGHTLCTGSYRDSSIFIAMSTLFRLPQGFGHGRLYMKYTDDRDTEPYVIPLLELSHDTLTLFNSLVSNMAAVRSINAIPGTENVGKSEEGGTCHSEAPIQKAAASVDADLVNTERMDNNTSESVHTSLSNQLVGSNSAAHIVRTGDSVAQVTPVKPLSTSGASVEVETEEGEGEGEQPSLPPLKSSGDEDVVTMEIHAEMDSLDPSCVSEVLDFMNTVEQTSAVSSAASDAPTEIVEVEMTTDVVTNAIDSGERDDEEDDDLESLPECLQIPANIVILNESQEGQVSEIDCAPTTSGAPVHQNALISGDNVKSIASSSVDISTSASMDIIENGSVIREDSSEGVVIDDKAPKPDVSIAKGSSPSKKLLAEVEQKNIIDQGRRSESSKASPAALSSSHSASLSSRKRSRSDEESEGRGDSTEGAATSSSAAAVDEKGARVVKSAVDKIEMMIEVNKKDQNKDNEKKRKLSNKAGKVEPDKSEKKSAKVPSKSKGVASKTEDDEEEEVVWTTDHPSIGTKVAGLFKDEAASKGKRKSVNIVFTGTVTKFADETAPNERDELYHIVWDDGDEEDFDTADLTEGVRRYSKKNR